MKALLRVVIVGLVVFAGYAAMTAPVPNGKYGPCPTPPQRPY